MRNGDFDAKIECVENDSVKKNTNPIQYILHLNISFIETNRYTLKE